MKKTEELKQLPQAILNAMLEVQKKRIREKGITLPSDSKLFTIDCPMWVRVQFLDWMLRGE